MRLSILINCKASIDTLDNAFVVLFDTIYKLLNTCEELFIQEAIKELVGLNFIISNLKLFRRKSLSKRIIMIICNICFISWRHWYKFIRLTFNKMIFPDTLDNIVLIKFTLSDSFLDHFPSLVKILLCLFMLTYIL